MLEEIWDASWFETLFCKSSTWYQVDQKPIMNPIHPNFQIYHPYVCHACKRGPITGGGTILYKCAKCRIVQYCCREHQIHDWKFHKTWCRAVQQLVKQDDDNMIVYASREEWYQSMFRLTGLLRTIMDENEQAQQVTTTFGFHSNFDRTTAMSQMLPGRNRSEREIDSMSQM
jgi:hypothetical protein